MTAEVANELVSRALVALLFSGVAYVYVRWWRNFAMANTRWALVLQRHRARVVRLLGGAGSSYEFNLGLSSFGALLVVMVSLAMWTFFCVGVLDARHGGLRPPSPVPATEATSTEAGGAVKAVIGAVGLGLCACGAHILRKRRKLASFYGWLHDISIPVRTEYREDGPDNAGGTLGRWTFFFGALGIVLIVTGAWMLLIVLALSV